MNIRTKQFDNLDWQQVGEFARQKQIQVDEKRVRLLELSAGFQETEWCDRGHIGYIIAGTVDMEFEDGFSTTYSQGDGLFLRDGQRHKATITTGKAELFLVDEV